MSLHVRAAFAALVLGALAAPALAQQTEQERTFSGAAKATNGDTLEMNGRSVRLNGVDALGEDQPCIKDGKPVSVAADAQKALEAIVAGKMLDCTAVSMDRQQRPIAECKIGDRSVQGALVASGWAYDYARFSNGAYKAQQDEAKAAKRGVWQPALQCRPPWEQREN